MRRRPTRKHARFGRPIEQQVMLARRRRAARRVRVVEMKRLSRIAMVEKLLAKINAELGIEETVYNRPKTREEHAARAAARGIWVRHGIENGSIPRMATALRTA